MVPRILLFLLLIALFGLPACGDPDCTRGRCGDDQAIARDLIDQVNFDIERLDHIDIRRTLPRVVFSSDKTHQTLHLATGDNQWLRVAVYSRGLPRPGFVLTDEEGFERHAPTHQQGSATRTFFSPNATTYALDFYTQDDPHSPRDGEEYVAFVERLSTPAPQTLSVSDEPFTMQADLLSDTPLFFEITSTGAEFQLLPGADSQFLLLHHRRDSPWSSWASTPATNELTSIPLHPQGGISTIIAVDHQKAHVDASSFTLTISPRAAVNPDPDPDPDATLAPGESLDFFTSADAPRQLFHLSSLSSFIHTSLDIFYDGELLFEDLPSGYGMVGSFGHYPLPHQGDYLLRITNRSGVPRDPFEIDLQPIVPHELGVLSPATSLSASLPVDADFLYANVEIDSPGLFQVRAFAPDRTPLIDLFAWDNPLEIQLSDATDPGSHSPLAQTEVAPIDSGHYLLRLRPRHPNRADTEIHLELQLEPHSP